MADTIAITGNTYPVRDALRALGGTWDKAARCWRVPADKAPQARALVAAAPQPARCGGIINHTRDRHDLPGGQLWQPCTRRGCETEPVCVHCELCARHCTCRAATTWMGTKSMDAEDSIF